MSGVDSRQAVERAQRAIEVADWNEGGWRAAAGLADDVLVLAAALADTERRLEALTMVGPQHDWDVRASRAEARVAELEAALRDAERLIELDDTYECGHGATVEDDCPEDCEAHRGMVRVAAALHPSGRASETTKETA